MELHTEGSNREREGRSEGWEKRKGGKGEWMNSKRKRERRKKEGRGERDEMERGGRRGKVKV